MNFEQAFKATGPDAAESAAQGAKIDDALAALGIRFFEDDARPRLDDAWLVEDVLPLSGLCAVYGPPGCGKSFFVLDMALAISGAHPTWRGKDLEAGAVLYLA